MTPTRTRIADGPGSAADGEFGSAAQRDRRKRILDATLALASKGGYDAVQMRAVAQKADVALGTLYRYFPSKIHLLVSRPGPGVRAEPGKAGPHADPRRYPLRPDAVRARPDHPGHAA